MEELKPCPFCGGVAIIDEYSAGGYTRLEYVAQCKQNSCIAYWISRRYKTKEDAIAAWNNRVQQP